MVKNPETERLFLSNQYLILKNIALLKGDNEEADLYDLAYRAVKGGFVLEYAVYNRWLENELSLEDCMFVRKVLSLYSDIYNSYGLLLKPIRISDKYIRFRGFNVTKESDFFAYCRYLFCCRKEYSVLREAVPDEEFCFIFNSSVPMCEYYKDMLQRWEMLGKPVFPMDEDTILRLLE